MADEVTKKDLQSLQGYVNKRIGDLEGRIKELAEGLKGNSQAHGMYERSFNEIYGRLGELERTVAALKKNA